MQAIRHTLLATELSTWSRNVRRKKWSHMVAGCRGRASEWRWRLYETWTSIAIRPSWRSTSCRRSTNGTRTTKSTGLFVLLFARLHVRIRTHTQTYRVAQKFGTLFVRLVTSSDIDQFSKVFHCQNHEKICNNILSAVIPPHLKCVATLPCEMSVSWKQQLKTRLLL